MNDFRCGGLGYFSENHNPIKSSLHSRYCAESGGAHLRGLVTTQHSSEEMSQRWRIAGDAVSDLTDPRPELQTSRTHSNVLATELENRMIQNVFQSISSHKKSFESSENPGSSPTREEMNSFEEKDNESLSSVKFRENGIKRQVTLCVRAFSKMP